MKVSKAQAQANRMHIVETAATLFREKGYDGIGVADLMAAAGFTHGGFYKHFGSKADLMAEAAACGLKKNTTKLANVDLVAFIQRYVSREHRDALSEGCTFAALSGDAARQPENIKQVFAEGIEALVATFTSNQTLATSNDVPVDRAVVLSTFAHMIGTVALARACPDNSDLADEILAVNLKALLASLPAKQAAQA